MTKQEVLAKLSAKLEANQAEVRRQLEFLAEIPGHEVHFPIASVMAQLDVPVAAGEPYPPCVKQIDLLVKLSETWKQGRALNEVMQELVGLVYPEPVPEQTRPTAPEMLQ